MHRYAPEIGQVSQERIRDEMTRMLTEGRARRAFELLDAAGLLPFVLPEVAKMKGVEQPPQYHPEGDVWIHTLMLLEQLPGRGFVRAGVGISAARRGQAGDVSSRRTRASRGIESGSTGTSRSGVRIAEVMLARLRFSNEATAQIVALIKHHHAVRRCEVDEGVYAEAVYPHAEV